MAKSNIRWRAKAVIEKVVNGVDKNLGKASEMLASDIRGSFPASGGSGTRSGGGDARNVSEPGWIPHVQTGFLKRNIGVQRKGRLWYRVGTGVGNKESVGYALWLELGTSRMEARPYMRPGLKRNKSRILKTAGRRVI